VGVSVWLWRTGRNVWFALLPAMFMVATTGTALVLNFRTFLSAYRLRPESLLLTNMSIAAVLFLLGGLVVFEAVRVWRLSRQSVPVASQHSTP
jgi:carbon starvation protein CstA